MDIYEKYEKYINQAQNGYIKGMTYQETIEILRYVEGKLGKNIPINTNCAVCMLDLLNMFIRLR